MSKAPHSAPILNDLRDRWWSVDYLQLIVSRLDLQQCTSIADIGCGHGHWGQLLLQLLGKDASLCGVDQEAEWVTRAQERSKELGLDARCRYLQGSAEALPLADASCDLVTCQTLLMHVADPSEVLREMIRVLRPGGRLVLLEPNNVAHQLVANSVNRALTAQQLAGVFALLATCSRGRAALGRGDDCIGDRLPSLLGELELENIQVFQNERAQYIAAPYSDEDAEGLQASQDLAKQKFWLWDKEDAAALYQAGGGEAADFEEHYAAFEAQSAIFAEQVANETYASNNASLHYIISATRHGR